MRKLDILLYTRASGGGGAERVWAILADGLAARGHRVTFAFDEKMAGDGIEPAVDAIEIGGGHAAAVLRLARLLRRRRFDVVAAAVSVSCVKLALAKALALSRTPLVLSYHGFEEYKTGRLSAAGYYGLPLLALLTSRFVGVSDGIVRALVERWRAPAARTERIYNPVPMIAAATAGDIAARPQIVGAVGRLSPEKGMDLLLDAFARLTTPDARLVIGGDGPERQRLVERAAGLGIGDRVRFLGRVASAAEVYGLARVAAVPSRTEAFGMTTVEALSAGLRVVATDCEGSREILAGPYGELVPVGDAAALAAALDRALATPPDPAPGVTRAQEFSAEAGIGQWERLFAGLAAPG
ncbi:Glycosyl transferase group 1 [uncultured Pleomorphomonas sp.]|uniref:Glycosyl transferase group 1 n=1 Tax=uncultured Pleomorphomonas sp. TaxID=442121 RepID=A0A212LIH4_9HYPH|nr:glycosyltransferase [uncultured Pleomorphomonas sp.]SCM77352.1 Glycosyl transferase group 1 [uncultured Pleomorphomonas sp.]